jgi:hypothetical protein
VQDDRCSRWALEVLGAPHLLHRVVPDCGLVHTDAAASQSWTFVDSATPAEIARLLDALTGAGADPVAARVDTREPSATQALA